MTIPKGGASRDALQLGAGRALVMVGTRCGMNGQQGQIGNNFNTHHQRMYLPYGADAISFVFSGVWQTGGNGEQPMPPSMFQALSVVYSGGTGYVAGDVDTFA